VAQTNVFIIPLTKCFGPDRPSVGDTWEMYDWQWNSVKYHLRLTNVLERIFRTVVNRYTLQTLPTVSTKHFFMNILCIESIFPQKTHNRKLLFGSIPQARSPFWLLKSASEHAHARSILRLSWSWNVLLPSDTHNKPITSVTAVLLPFVTYLLTSLYNASVNLKICLLN
jgi:hypothetical protein